MASTGAISPSQAGYNLVRTPKRSPDVQQRLDSLRGQVQPGATQGIDYLNKLAGGGDDVFRDIEEPAYRDFANTQNSIASRFSGQGTGSRRSSGFYQEMGGASSDLASNLQGQRMKLQQSAIDQLLGLYSGLVSDDPYQYDLMEKKRKNRWGGLLSGATSGATAGSAFGHWGTGIGATVGGTLGYFGGS